MNALDGMFKDFEQAMKETPKQPEGQPNASAGGPFDQNFMNMFENLAKQLDDLEEDGDD